MDNGTDYRRLKMERLKVYHEGAGAEAELERIFSELKDVEEEKQPLDVEGWRPTPPASDLMYFYRFVPGVDASEYHTYFHTDWETPETVPWTGLEASTRAFAHRGR